MKDYMTTDQIAAELGVSHRRAQQLARETEGAEKLGRDWVIPEAAVPTLLERRKPGRPPKSD